MAKINKIKLSGTSYDIQDLNASKTVELTQAQYDALVTKDPNTFYIITDAQGGDLSNYYTKSETSGATEISTALASKQTTLTAGTGINITDNVISATGGGGKAIEAGSGIAITTGTTADTISIGKPFTIQTSSTTPENIYIGSDADIYMGSSNSVYGNVAVGRRCTFKNVGTTQSQYNFLGGDMCAVCGSNKSIVFGNGNISYRSCSAVFGDGNIAKNYYEFASGVYNNTSSGSTTFGDSRNVLASFGNGNWGGTRHNALEIRQNGDIYIADTNDTSTSNFYEKPMIKLQDALGGGGGSSYTAGDGIDITNDVISVTGKVDTTTYNTYTAATDTALASKQTTLTAGTGINITDNVISATGGGGGKAISGGTNISITTGETADTINCTLPIREGSNSNGKGIIVGDSECTAKGLYAISLGHSSDADGNYSFCNGSNSYARGQMSFAYGNGCDAKNDFTFMVGWHNVSTTPYQYSFGKDIKPKNELEFGFGTYNNSSSASTTFGYSGNTMFSIGNGYDYSSTHNPHNAFEVRQNGDIYVPNTDDSSVTGNYAYSLYPMVRLQDTITATAANTTALGGLSLVKLTQTEYDNLSTKDSNTLYVIVN